MKQHFSKWFNLKYGKLLIRTICLLPWKYFTGFYNPHLALAYKKDTFLEVWDAEHEILDKTCHNKFRNNEDINQYIFRYWRLVKGEFAPSRIIGRSINISNSNDAIRSAIVNKKYKIVCLNDSDDLENYEEIKLEIKSWFDLVLSEKSSFEL